MANRGLIVLIISFVVLVFGLFVLFRAAPQETAELTPAPDAKVKVAATIFPLYDIVRNVAGDEAEVKLLLPPGASPHTYEVLPSTLRELQDLSTVFAIGHGVDDWTEAIVNAAGGTVVLTDEGISLRSLEGDEDPHYWLHIGNAMRIARTVQHELTRIDQRNAAVYETNANAFIAELAETEQELRRELENLASREIVTLHDAWFYFADNFELDIVGFLEPEGGREPTPRQLAALRETIRDHDIRILFSEPQLSGASLQAFAEDNELGIAELDPLGGMEGRMSFIELMKYNVGAVREAGAQ